MHAATSKVENSAQGSSCQLKFFHGFATLFTSQRKREKDRQRDKEREGGRERERKRERGRERCPELLFLF
jgi:hypothetical protein